MDSGLVSICNSLNLDVEKLFKGILEGIDDIIGVYKPDNTLLFYNKAGYEFFNTTQDRVFGKKCFEMLNRESRCVTCTTHMALEKGGLVRIEKYIPEIKRYMECTANPVFDCNGEIILIVEQLRDITDERSDLRRAANIQKQRLEAAFPIPDKASMKAIYRPAMEISGDFYHVNKINENCVVGLIGDVSGKGIGAALSISAMKVLFHEAMQHFEKPAEILGYLNSKLDTHFSEDFVAACCFKIDFQYGYLSVSCAALNEFRIYNQDQIEKHELSGPFLGMFEDTVFEQKEYVIDSGSKLVFYTDGFQLLEDQGLIDIDAIQHMDFDAVNSKIKGILKEDIGVKDDCTLISIDII